MPSGLHNWSTTAATNATADSAINWAEGQAPSSVNDSARAMMAVVAKHRDDTAGSLTTGGTSTAYTLTTNTVFTTLALLSGQKLKVRFNAANGASPTLNVDGLGAKAIQVKSGTAVGTGVIGADSVWDVTYDNSIPAFLLSDVPAQIQDGTVATASIAADAVTYAKMQNVSATSRILGRKTAAAGDTEECTLSEVLDFIGSAAQGDVLYRGASAWARLGAGTAGQVLKTGGAAANPSWFTLPLTASYAGSIALGSISTSAYSDFTHGLGSIPLIVQIFLSCATDDNGYVAGDVVALPAGANSGSGLGVTVTSTLIRLVRNTNGTQVVNPTTGNTASVTVARWNVLIKAFA